MRLLVVPAMMLALVLSGCAGPEPVGEPVEGTQTDLPDPVVQEFQGHMTASAAGPLAHQDAETEMLVADWQREGFVLEVVAVPQSLQVDLVWSSPAPTASMFSMVNIPTGVEGQVLDVLSERDATGHVCMQVPLDEVQPGLLSVMVHSSNAAAIDYVVQVTTVGGEVVLHADRGHMEVEREGGDAVDALPCPEA